MLRLTAFFLITIFTLVCVFTPQHTQSFASLTRLTNTSEHALNLNPTISDDGRIVVFESSADLAGKAQDPSFHALWTDVTASPAFHEIASTRAICPALSRDGHRIAFASREDLTGENADRNSEIFLFDGLKLRQLTHTEHSDGNFQPSITSDGRMIAYSANGQIVLFDTLSEKYRQLTNESPDHSAVNPKISGDGSRVYYQRNDLGADKVDLVLIDAETSSDQIIAAGVAGLEITAGRGVSDDGMRFVYSASTGTNQTQVFLFEARDRSIRQLTQLGSRSSDVKLQPTISGDGRRVAFATRRRVLNTSDGGVELYVLDLPSGQVQQITNAPSTATAEVIASLNFDGSLVAFSFPRVLSGPVSDDDLGNNSEIYLASVAPRPVGVASIVNAAALRHEPQPDNLAPGSIASIRGKGLALKTERAIFSGDEPPFQVAGTTVTVNGQPAPIYYVSDGEVVFVVPDGLPNGPAQFFVTNEDGLSSKAEAIISSAAPGIFTASADGRGEAIILNSDTLTRVPFDPTNGDLRLSIFATGVAHANHVSININGKPSIFETVARARLLGLDEIHILVPADLRGAGPSTLIVTADGLQSNPVSVTISGKDPSPSVSPRIVISQVFGGGGNSGAPFRNDFIEIVNAGSAAIDLSGWSVQYASATASSWSVTPLSSITLAPGHYYLIQESSGGSAGLALPAADVAGTIAMAAGSGKVALVKSLTALSGGCPTDPNIVDLVGYGSTASCFRGSAPAPAPSNTNAILRGGAGCTDTRNNVSDFVLGPPNPRNTIFSSRICTDP